MPFQRQFNLLRLLIPTYVAATSATATVTGATVDLQGYINPGGREMKATLEASVTATGSLAVKLQESADDSAWTDISGATFTTLTNTGATESLHFNTVNRYVRAVATHNSNVMAFAANLLAEKRTS